VSAVSSLTVSIADPREPTNAQRTLGCSCCAMTKRPAWVGDGAPRMEVAEVTQIEPTFAASGTQLGTTYELRNVLGPETLRLELVGERTLELGLDGADFFDLGWSPLFNSLPVIRDRLLDPGPARDYRMRRVEVPSLEVTISEQRYRPLGDGVVRYPGIGARRPAPAVTGHPIGQAAAADLLRGPGS
jgi:hypothetical protein